MLKSFAPAPELLLTVNNRHTMPTDINQQQTTTHNTLSSNSTPTLQHSNTPTLQHSNTPTLQHCNTATRQTPNFFRFGRSVVRSFGRSSFVRRSSFVVRRSSFVVRRSSFVFVASSLLRRLCVATEVVLVAGYVCTVRRCYSLWKCCRCCYVVVFWSMFVEV